MYNLIDSINRALTAVFLTVTILFFTAITGLFLAMMATLAFTL